MAGEQTEDTPESLFPLLGESAVLLLSVTVLAWTLHLNTDRDDVAIGLVACTFLACALAVLNQRRRERSWAIVARSRNRLTSVDDVLVTSAKDLEEDFPGKLTNIIDEDDSSKEITQEGVHQGQGKGVALPKRRQYLLGGEIIYIARGVKEGAVGLLRDPVRGGQEEGVRGFAKGLGTGVFGVVGRPVRGIFRAGGNTCIGLRNSAYIVLGASRVSSRGKGTRSTNIAPRSMEVGDEASSEGLDEGGGGKELPPNLEQTPVPGVSLLQAETLGTPMTMNPSHKGIPNLRGLAVGVVTVPLLLCSLVIASSSLSEGAHAGGIHLMNHNGCRGNGLRNFSGLSEGKMGNEQVLQSNDLTKYLWTVLEGSILCSMSEVLSALQKTLFLLPFDKVATEPQRPLWASAPVRVVFLVALALRKFQQPLLPLWCLAMHDLMTSTLEANREKIMLQLSLRGGEAAVLAQGLAIWGVDAALLTLQELRSEESGVLRLLFPLVPARSESMIVVQSGVLGTLGTGLMLAVVRGVVPETGPVSHLATYLCIVASTAIWLFCWTAPLLHMNPLTWVATEILGSATPGHHSHHHNLGLATEEVSEQWLGEEPVSGSELEPGGGILILTRPDMGVGDGVALDIGNNAPPEVLYRGVMETITGIGWGDRISQRIWLCLMWAVVLCVVTPAVPVIVRRLRLRKTVTRKAFHLLAIALFLPAIVLEAEFLSLALGVALGVLLVAEYIRCTGCPPLASPISHYFKNFLDDRDGGCVVVTHLYLLLGCALPVWLSGYGGDMTQWGVIPYSGVIVLGVGDMMGAVVGISLGRRGHRWPGSRRTLEGSVAVFCSTLLALVAVHCLVLYGKRLSVCGEGFTMEECQRRPGINAQWKKVALDLAGPVALTSLMEAFTSQVDNLVLPCILVSLLANFV